MRKVLLFVLAATFGVAAWADTLIMRDGARYTGTLIDGNSRQVTFADQNGMRRTFNTSEIQAVEFQSGAYSQGQTGGVQMGAALLPAGTQIAVRTNENIDSTSAATGRTYSATITRDVLDQNGNVVIPNGSPAQLIVRNISSGGTFGSAELALDLQSVDVNGQRYTVSTADVQQQGAGGLGANKRTGEYVGGGALLGTVLGAIAGGGKGAAIGALGGAAAGAGVQVLTRGKEVHVPAETQLTFRLDQPLQLQPMRR
ncbi:MAG TPA: hypothetical protein VFA54_00090 [Bryobacterales bacterium]|jgi:hypothetical protein|nr:hypothetical protein [Bryobacterales bacterium]